MICFSLKYKYYTLCVILQSMNSEVLTKRRLIRYLTPVIVLSILYNLNRLFEAEVRWVNDLPKISATKLRMESEAYNLSVLSIRCIVLGIFPVMILVFLNTKIYKDVQERRARNVCSIFECIQIY